MSQVHHEKNLEEGHPIHISNKVGSSPPRMVLIKVWVWPPKALI